MTEQDFAVALAAVRQQREAALDALAQNAVVINQLQRRIAELEAELRAALAAEESVTRRDAKRDARRDAKRDAP